MAPRCFKESMAGVPLACTNSNPAHNDWKIWKHKTLFLNEPHGLRAAPLHVCYIFLLLLENWLSMFYVFSLLPTKISTSLLLWYAMALTHSTESFSLNSFHQASYSKTTDWPLMGQMSTSGSTGAKKKCNR